MMGRFPLYKQHDSMQCGIACLQMICRYLMEFYKGKTVVGVAHRLSTVKNAGRIVVIDKVSLVICAK